MGRSTQCVKEMDAPAWFLALMSIGGLYLTAACLRHFPYLMVCMRRPKDLRGVYGTWAVITGPTSGMGLSMAMELARRGLNLVLVGRDPAKLQDVYDAVAVQHAGVRTKTVVFDLSLVSTAQGYESIRRLREAVQGLDVGVLVNNAGVAEPDCVYLHEADVEGLVRMIRVNLSALTQVTAAVLPVMLNKGRSAIINIGSASAVVLPSFPLNSVYSATKRYVTEFSKSLYVEYRSKGIDVQCQVPLFVDTKMLSNVAEGGYSPPVVVTPDGFARAAVRWIGHGPLCIPHVEHRIEAWFYSLLPEFLVDFYCLRQALQLRQNILRLRRLSSSGATQVDQFPSRGQSAGLLSHPVTEKIVDMKWHAMRMPTALSTHSCTIIPTNKMLQSDK